MTSRFPGDPSGAPRRFLLALALLGCSSQESSPGSSPSPSSTQPPASACMPQQARACVADGGQPGTQRCNAAGDAFEPCSAAAPFAPDPQHWATSELLGRPHARGAALNIVPAVAVEAYVDAQPEAGGASVKTPTLKGEAGQPLVFAIDGLEPDTRYSYRVLYRLSDTQAFAARPARRFHTQRKPGSSFVFTIQADSHLDDKSSVELYHRTLDLASAASPDFHIDLGDTFMCDKHSAPLTGEVKPAGSLDIVMARYLSERAHFDLLAHSTPLMLVNGNHEGESGFQLDGTPDNVAVWATQARKRYYPNPEPGDFYSAPSASDPLVGSRQHPYAWHWGDALFVAIDPFWYTTTKAKGGNRWAWTLGKEQYEWLSKTLLESKATYKFVFAHHIVGGNHDASRGGVEAAPYFEWGGKELDGTDTFAKNRPGWAKPVHALFVEAGVSAFFHGHDHVYVHQELDGVVYQEVPQPSATNFNNGASIAQEAGYVSGTILDSSGHLRVSVSPGETRVEYVRSYLPEDETSGRVHGSIDHSYTIVTP